jgi:hypoxanthine phosphoribosyltransferase
MLNSTAQITAVLEQADQLYSADQVEQAIDQMAHSIASEIGECCPVVLSVMTGGIVLTGRLLPKLLFPLQLDYVHATRYRGQIQGTDIHWLVRPHSILKDRTVLIVDDILDEGQTLLAIIDECFKEQAKAVYSAVLVEKRHTRKAPGVRADYIGLYVEDRYVFGAGMDYKGYGRNAPGIYAVA